MATFEAQVEALTGISIDGSSNPTLTELSLFLVDGVKDVIHRMIRVKPEEFVRFTSTTNSTSSIAQVGKIFTVVREHDSTTILRKCKRIPAGDRYDATDVDSLKYRSKHSPGFYELNGSIFTVPEAGSGNNDIVVTQIFYDTGVAFGDEVPDNFPESYAYLVALYAAIKSLGAKMSAIRASLSSFSVTAVPPDLPATGASLPTYDDPDNDDAGGRSVSDEIDQMLSYIESSEDVELANAKASEVGLRFKRALDQFNSDMQAYQAENQGEIAHYSAEIQAYTAEINAEVQEQQAKVQTETAKYTWLQDRGSSLQAEYTAAFATPQTQPQQQQRGR